MTTTAIDWPAVHTEARDILSRYLQIDTTNPPGNETAAARFLGALLEAEGIECRYIESQPGREFLIARIAGDGSRRGLMLGNHTDVVPVEEAYWTVPPFGGEVRDGRIYGRGAMDMKGCGVMQLMTMLLVRRLDLPLTRELVFLAAPDEEAGSRWGMEWLCANHPELVDVEFALNEGGSGRLVSGRKVFSVAVNEKVGSGLRLTATGTAGHASLPNDDNSAVHLARAIVRLADWDRGLTFVPEMETYVRELASAGLLPPLEEREALEREIRARRGLLPMFINTLNVTIVNAGYKSNVVPAKSEATVDCRLLPGQSRDEWREAVIERIGDPRVQVEFVNPTARPQVQATPWDTDLLRAIRSSVTSAMEDAIVVPTMMEGATDNRFLRTRGVVAYGFIPALFSREEGATFHGNDEFITEENLALGCELTFDIVRRLCT